MCHIAHNFSCWFTSFVILAVVHIEMTSEARGHWGFGQSGSFDVFQHAQNLTATHIFHPKSRFMSHIFVCEMSFDVHETL